LRGVIGEFLIVGIFSIFYRNPIACQDDFPVYFGSREIVE